MGGPRKTVITYTTIDGNYEDLGRVVKQITSIYSKNVTDEVVEEVKRSTKELVKEIERNSPVRTGDYKNSWRSKIVLSDLTNRVFGRVYNKEYWLVHLLEKGHKGVEGESRLFRSDGTLISTRKYKFGDVKPHPHVLPAREKIADVFEKRIADILKG